MTPRYRFVPPGLAYRIGMLAALLTLAVPAFADPSVRDRLAAAESWVDRARARDALWTTAIQHLRAARAALAAGRDAEAAALADEAAELARLGLQQRDRAETVPPP